MSPLSQTPEHPAIYARVSMDRGKLSESVRDQVNRARPRCADLGWGEPVVYRDNDVSATKNVVRLGFERLLRGIADETIDGIIVRHLDRLLRQQKDLDRLKDIIRERGDYVPLTMIEGPTFDLRQAQDLFLVTLLVGFGTMESDVKRERVRDSRKRDAESGKPPPRMGYGYDENHRIVPSEARVIREATDRILDGEPLRAIVTDFNNRDVPSPGAGKWVAEVVRRAVDSDDRPVVRELIQILRREEPQDPVAIASLLRKAGSDWSARDVRESYEYDQHLEADDHGAPDSAIARLFRQAGVPAPRTYWSTRTLRNILWRGTISGVRDYEAKRQGSKTNGKAVATGKWTPIIEPETHQRLRDVLEGRKAAPRARRKYLLSGVLRCGNTLKDEHGNDTGRVCGTPLSSDTLNYKNGRKPSYRYKCTKQPGRKDICGNLSVTGPETDKFVIAVVLDALSTEGATSGRHHLGRNAAEVESAEERIRLAEERKKRHFDSLRKGTLDQDQYDLLVSDINKQIRTDLRTVRSYSPAVQELISDAPRERGELDAWFESLDMDDQREVIRGVLLGVTVLPSKPRRSLDVARFTDWDWAYAASESTDASA